ncbi:ankyrin repeat-containing domain protein [Aspergillus insuetus]
MGDIDSLRTCLEAGAPYNSWWMLIDGVNHNQIEIIKYVLDAGYGFADRAKKQICMTKLMQRAIVKGNSEIVGIFLDRGFDAGDSVDPRIFVDGRYYSVTLVSYAAFQDQVGVLVVLLQRGMGVEDPGVPVRPVYWAVKHDSLEMMKVFIEHKVDLGPGKSDEGENWPLKWAIKSGSVEMVRLLLQHTRLRRMGCPLKKMLCRAVQERGDDDIGRELASYEIK